MELTPQELSPAERYKLLIGGIVPRPIAWVSTLSPEGITNLAPFSFFTGAGSDPMTLLFCPANDSQGREKDTLRNAKLVGDGGQGEFVVNVVSDAMAETMAATAESLKANESEFDAFSVAVAPSRVVAPPRVAQSLVHYECRTSQLLRLKPGSPGGGNVVLGEVVHVHVADEVLGERLRIDPSALDAIGRMGGFGYTRTRDRFELRAGAAALDEGRSDTAQAGRDRLSRHRRDQLP
jgi:flavin reductase (DIM6/NTAB) family NADH-FMN oxidoreductase RutF